MVGSENVQNVGSAEQSTVVLIEIIIWNAALILLNGGVYSNAFFVFLRPDLAHFLLGSTMPPLKGNISTLKLTVDTNEVALESIKNMLIGMVCNTIIPHFQITPEIYYTFIVLFLNLFSILWEL